MPARAAAVLCLLPLLVASTASAQVTPPLVFPVVVDAAQVRGSCIDQAVVQIVISTPDGPPWTAPPITCGGGQFALDTRALPLRSRYMVRATQTLNGTASSAQEVEVGVGALGPPFHDEREDFEAGAYVGLAIDTFGAQEIRNYLNPEANGIIEERSIFGFDFSYRLFRSATRPLQIWVYGETVHGVRSEDIDCAAAPNLPSCQRELAEFAGSVPTASLYMLRNATSLEALVGVRLELRSLNLPGRHPAVVYASLQPGFLEVAGSDGDAKAMHHVAVGARSVGGPRQGSYLEIGFGKTELFVKNRNRRWKIDGMLQQTIAGGFSLFAQLFADVDLADGADSIQSYFGLGFDVQAIVGTITGND